MATADVIAEVAYARFLREFDYNIIWPRVSMDVSAELSEYGDSISFPTDDSDPAVTDITLANLQGDTLANHQWPDPGIGSQTDVTLTVAGKRINQLIPTTHQAQVRPSILNRRMELVGRKMARAVNDSVRVAALGVAAASQLTAISVTATQFGNKQAAFLTSLRNSFYEAQTALDYEGMPEEGRYAMISARLHSYIMQHFETAKIPFDGMFNEDLVARGSVPLLNSFRMVKDVSLGDGTTNADDAKHNIVFLRMGEGIAYGQQVFNMAAVDGMTSGSDYDGWLIRGRMIFGSAVVEADKLRVQKIEIS